MHRIAVLTSDLTKDWASSELLDAVNRLATGSAIDPLTIDMRVDGGASLIAGGESLYGYDAFIMRGFNRDGETDYQYEILELLEGKGKLVVNSPAALSLAESKAQTTFCFQEAGIPVPRTTVTHSVKAAREALADYGKAVLKPLYGSQGADMEIVSSVNADEILPAFLEKHRVIYMQEFIENNGRDIRAFVVGDEVPGAIYRVASEGQWRTNVAQGGSAHACVLSAELRDLCVEATRTAGLEYTGVDIIEGQDGPMVLEVNGAPWWKGLLQATGRNVAVDIVRHVIRLLEARKPARQPNVWHDKQMAIT
jgi:RimK family alpha-L-glutamate ligase